MEQVTPIFKLKDQKADTKTAINLILYFNKDRFKYSTGLSINPLLWDKETERPYLKNNAPGLTVTLTKEDILQATLIDNELNKFIKETRRIINYFSYQDTIPTNELLKIEFDKVFRKETPKSKIKEPEVVTLNSYIKSFLSDIETGKRTTEKGTRYTNGTIKNYKGFQTQFDNYQTENRKKLNFDNITIDFYDKYVAYFNKKNYSPNTIGRHIKSLKVIMRAAIEEGFTKNQEIDRKKFKVITAEVQPIYLTQKEIENINNLDLSDKENKTYDVARDIFLIGCYTAQRFSDYSRINSQHIKEVNGGKVIDLIQKKTGERVIIPIMPELEGIFKKYDYNPPRTHEQKINERIKIVCEKAKVNELIEIEEIKGGLKVTQRKPKYDLIKTHTARRTGATLMFLAGIPTISIMKITGHKTEREFLKYIRVTKEETAQTLMNHPYFIGTPLKLVK